MTDFSRYEIDGELEVQPKDESTCFGERHEKLAAFTWKREGEGTLIVPAKQFIRMPSTQKEPASVADP